VNLQNNVAANGFAIVPHVLPASEAAQILVALSSLPPRRSRAGARHILSHPAVAGLAADARLLLLARQVLGSDAFPFRATLFDKSSTANWLVSWHQDTALPLEERHEAPGWGPWSNKDGVHYAHAPAAALEQVLALRLHLDESTLTNGPLRVLPATHTLGVLTDEAIHRLAATATALTCPVSAGGVVAMRPLIIHASSKSQSMAPRRVIHIEYAVSPIIDAPLQLAAPAPIQSRYA
jgi:ectoine hydroxylase-related dioxygenase (phytanoyl-CoA dioxygenase family)